jgi:hypothetical protein
MPTSSSPTSPPAPSSRKPGRIRLLLLLPYLALLFPALYARNTPALWGIPFFYWYQFFWVLLASAIIGLVFFRTRDFL